MNRCKYIQPVHAELKFGVDLNEIFPPWYLHPAIKNLIYLAESNVKCRHGSRFDIEELLSKGNHGEGTIRQRLDLKERLIAGKNIIDIDVSPGVPIWLIRHFLGLLPTPIFPPKYDEHYWYNFCIRLYEQFTDSVKRRNANNDLKETVAFELAHLPPRSITFLFEFFELIRFLSMKNVDDDVVDKHAALLFVRYYTPSMIVRPYRPGILSKNDKKYFAFILFCIHFWPDLRDKIHNLFIHSMNKNPQKFYYYPEFYDKYSDNNFYLKDAGTQTELDCESDLLLSIDSSSEESSDKRRNKTTTNKHFHDKFESLNFHVHTTCFKLVDSDEESNYVFSSTPNCEKLQKGSLKDCPVTSKLKDKINLESINKEKELPEDSFGDLSPTSLSIMKNRLPLLEKVSSENIDQYYKTINKSNCTFLKTASTQTNIPCPKPEVQSVHSNYTVKTHARNRKIFLKKPKQKNNIVILQFPSAGKIKGKNVKIVSYQKSKQKLLKNQDPKIVKSEPKTRTKIEENDNESKEVSNIKHNTSDSWKMDSNISNGDFIYDSFLGNCYDESQPTEQPTLQPKKLFSTYSITPQPTPSVDLYKRITKYGWTYNNSKSNIHIPDQSETYKSFENDEKSQRSLKSLTSETPLTEEVKKKKSITSSLKRMGSKLMFFKKKSSEMKKAVSCTDLHSNVKYEKISKSANSI